MQDMILMPSPNSAFTRTGKNERESIPPSFHLRKRLLFEEKSFSRKESRAELSELMRNSQSAFASRWNCRCDVIMGDCYGHRVEPIKTAKIPKCDWAPIDPSSDAEVKSIQSTETRSCKRLRRPVAPIPFTNLSQSHPYVSFPNTNYDKENNRVINVTLPEVCFTPPSSPENCEFRKSNAILTKSNSKLGWI